MFEEFLLEEDGAQTLEIAIITATLLAIVIVFRKQIMSLWNKEATEMEKMEESIESST